VFLTDVLKGAYQAAKQRDNVLFRRFGCERG
jgi:hypothetical protein